MLKDNPELQEIFFDWYRQKFDESNVYHWIWRKQKYFNLVAPVPCCGFSFMRDLHRKGTNRCCHPLCPSCWHTRQGDMLQALDKAVSCHFYERSIGPYSRTTFPEDNALKRLLARGTSWKCIGWGLFIDAAATRPSADDIAADSFGGEMFYYAKGVFMRDKLTRAYRSTAVGNVVLQDLVTVEEVSPEVGPVHHWLDQLRHPSEFEHHPDYRDFIRYFCLNKPLGRSWLRIVRS